MRQSTGASCLGATTIGYWFEKRRALQIQSLLIYKKRDEINHIHDLICNLKENDEYLKMELQP